MNSDNINLDEYYFKNDLLNYLDSIIYDENTTKQIDPLLLFRLELNSHSAYVSIKIEKSLIYNCNTLFLNICYLFNNISTNVQSCRNKIFFGFFNLNLKNYN